MSKKTKNFPKPNWLDGVALIVIIGFIVALVRRKK